MTTAVDPCPAVGLQQLLTIAQPELVRMWTTLPAPAEDELDGEYAGFLPIHGLPDDAVRALVQAMYQERSRNGYWIGKAYSAGAGYNVFRTATGDGYEFPRAGRFTTRIGASLVDGRPALLMDYTVFNNQPGRAGLIDEIRRLSTGLYLGTATHPKPDGTRTEATGCFLLNGPISPWHGVDDPARELRQA
ncbi:hypothetical protein JOF56_008443 [Kibdelosporangium banguiense]|uniref:Uncharacterized protein n=1 Tax=Kibdelosporangium banguiense TaxID=1365924 RepID=A0ABS4TVR9_9PSEU|nr:hypothetical protein [Kibdelosporangium banguiense]MBP2328058.1 hypothetical protein [Kibdelosporangium banguiense]